MHNKVGDDSERTCAHLATAQTGWLRVEVGARPGQWIREKPACSETRRELSCQRLITIHFSGSQSHGHTYLKPGQSSGAASHQHHQAWNTSTSQFWAFFLIVMGMPGATDNLLALDRIYIPAQKCDTMAKGFSGFIHHDPYFPARLIKDFKGL